MFSSRHSDAVRSLFLWDWFYFQLKGLGLFWICFQFEAHILHWTAPVPQGIAGLISNQCCCWLLLATPHWEWLMEKGRMINGLPSTNNSERIVMVGRQVCGGNQRVLWMYLALVIPSVIEHVGWHILSACPNSKSNDGHLCLWFRFLLLNRVVHSYAGETVLSSDCNTSCKNNNGTLLFFYYWGKLYTQLQ